MTRRAGMVVRRNAGRCFAAEPSLRGDGSSAGERLAGWLVVVADAVVLVGDGTKRSGEWCHSSRAREGSFWVRAEQRLVAEELD